MTRRVAVACSLWYVLAVMSPPSAAASDEWKPRRAVPAKAGAGAPDPALGVLRDLAGAHERCDSGDAAACYGVFKAWTYSFVDNAAARAATSIERACTGGYGYACVFEGAFVRRGAGQAWIDRGLAQDTARCEAGDLEACATMGLLLAQGVGVPADGGAAITYLTRACSGGLASACRAHGMVLENGFGVAKDLAAAIPLYQRACSAKRPDAIACFYLGNLARDGKLGGDVVVQPRYMDACVAGVPPACAAAIEGLRAQPASARRRASMARVAERGCALGSQVACSQVAMDAIAGGADPTEHLDALVDSCASEPGPACLVAGRVLTSDGPLRNDEMALQIWLASCAKGLGEACESAAVLIESGRVAKSAGAGADAIDAAGVVRLMGCAAEHGPSCQSARRMCLETPASCPSYDPVLGALVREACWAGDAQACERAAHLVIEQRATLIMLAVHGVRPEDIRPLRLRVDGDSRLLTTHAAALSEAACGTGDSEACIRAARLHSLRRLPPTLGYDPALHEGYLRKACTLGAATGCADLARALGTDNPKAGVARARAATLARARLLERAKEKAAAARLCSGLKRQGCLDEARLTDEDARRLVLLEKACRLKSAQGCHLAAVELSPFDAEPDDKPAPRDMNERLVRATALDLKACKLGSEQGCITSDRRALAGPPGGARTGALGRLEKQCFVGVSAACKATANELVRQVDEARGETPAALEQRLDRVQEQACRVGVLSSCMTRMPRKR